MKAHVVETSVTTNNSLSQDYSQQLTLYFYSLVQAIYSQDTDNGQSGNYLYVSPPLPYTPKMSAQH